MRGILGLFAKSPFKALKAHMDKARECYLLLEPLFEAAFRGDEEECDRIFRQIHELEHEADEIKDEIRDTMPRSLFLPVDRRDLLTALQAQDSIPDMVEDIGMLLRIRPSKYPEWMKGQIRDLVGKAIEVCESSRAIVQELDLLLEASFSGPEAEKVHEMIGENGLLEHQADVIGYRLARDLYRHESELSPVDVVWFNDLFRAIGELANYAEKVAKHFRLFLAH
jgi:predicted phosphate transport protein (TIGR00153 family)